MKVKHFHFVLAFLERFYAGAVVQIPPTAQDKISQYKIDNESKGSGPIKFAETNEVLIKPGDSDGEWTESSSINDRSIWSMTVESKGAMSLNFGFSMFELPAGSILTFENASPIRDDVPSLTFDLEQYSENSELWTPIMATDKVAISLEMPGIVNIADVKIELTSVNVGFKEIGSVNDVSANSGRCNIDVVCPVSAGWESEIRAAAGYSFGGGLFCSGSMINNMESDGTP